MQLYNGRPTDTSLREKKEIQVYDFLDSLNISFQRVDHAPADTMKECNDIDSILKTSICKNLFLCNRQETQFYLLMMPGNKTFKTKEISGQLGCSRLSFATSENMIKHLNILPGSVSIMGLIFDKENSVKLIIDEDVLKDEFIACHPCVNTSSLKIKTSDITDIFLPAVNHDKVIVKLVGE